MVYSGFQAEKLTDGIDFFRSSCQLIIAKPPMFCGVMKEWRSTVAMGLNVTKKNLMVRHCLYHTNHLRLMRVAKILLIESILSKLEDIAGFDTMPHNE